MQVPPVELRALGHRESAVLRGARTAARGSRRLSHARIGGDRGAHRRSAVAARSHEQPGAFLDTVTHEFRSQAFAGSGAARSRIGERIGAYRIVGLLGTRRHGRCVPGGSRRRSIPRGSRHQAHARRRAQHAHRAAFPDRAPDSRGPRPSQHRAPARWRHGGWRRPVRGHGARRRASPSTPGAMRGNSACASACNSSCRCARP